MAARLSPFTLSGEGATMVEYMLGGPYLDCLVMK
jgi:hypothetical protein